MSLRNVFLCVCLVALGSATSVSAEELIKVKASDKAACMPDAIRLCRDAMPDVRNVLVCFGKHRGQISNRCNAVLASYGL